MVETIHTLAQMRAMVDRAQAEPEHAARTAMRVLDRLGQHELGTELEATAAWAAGLATRELNDLDAADSHLERGVRAAATAGIPRLAGQIRVSWALVLAYRGRGEAALAELLKAEAVLEGADLARARMQRGLLHQRAGDLDAALAAYNEALPRLIQAGDRVAEVRLRANRAVASIYRSEFDDANQDLRSARTIALELDQRLQAAVCAHNLGYLFGCRGDLAMALSWLDLALAESRELGTDAGLGSVVLADRSELLASVGLVTEALADALSARDTIAETKNVFELAESSLLVARVALAAGDYEQASEAAHDAADGFRQQRRLPWVLLADSVAIRASSDVVSLSRGLPGIEDGLDLKSMGERASSLADDLTEAGWSSDALTMRLVAGQLWLSASDTTMAVKELRRASRNRYRGPAAHRVLAWHAEAIARLAAGDRSAARRAIRAGLRVVDQHRLTLAAADLRATVSSTADKLASWLVELALDSRKARDVLASAEAWRAGSLVAPVSPPPDAELERLLGRLRSLDADQRQQAGEAPGAERATLEAAVRDRARQLPSGGRRATVPFSVGALVEHVGDRMLVEFVESRDQLYVIWITDGVARMRAVGDVADAVREARSARGCLQRLATGAGSVRSLAAAADTLTTATERLADQLFGPVRVQPGRPIIVIPTGSLHGVPWSALRPLAEAPFVVAPSARSWLAADRRLSGAESGAGKVLLAAGPDLDGAREEVNEISGLHRDVLTLTGADATVEAVLGGLEGANVAHLAAHGNFRTDNPLLSALRLADGNLTVYDIERVPRIPPTMILSACDAAAVRVHAGDELLGFSSTMLGLGATTVVAPILPVADDVTTDLLVELHRALVAGASVSEALRRARVSLLEIAGSEVDVYRRRAAAGSFVAIGA